MPRKNKRALFGSFLSPRHKRYKQYIRRVEETEKTAREALLSLEYLHPELKGLVSVSFPNILIAAGRYLNDLVLFDEGHQIERFHRAKAIAYELKWFLLHPPLVATCSAEHYERLTPKVRELLLDIPYLGMDLIIAHLLKNDVILYEEISDKKRRDKIEETLDRLHYYAKTNAYSAKMASLYFDMLLAF